MSGYLVRGRDNEDLGCIEEFMVVMETGRIAYAVLSLGGNLGTNSMLYAVPWLALGLDAEQRVFVLKADRETLESAPVFHEEEWPDFTDPVWGSRVHKHYGLQPYWECT